VALTEDKIASLVRGIVEAVAFCHERKVCHRDLKLENLMLEHTGEDAGVKLIDFGFSKIFNSTEGMFAVLGSPYYVAHEVLVVNPNQKTGILPCHAQPSVVGVWFFQRKGGGAGGEEQGGFCGSVDMCLRVFVCVCVLTCMCVRERGLGGVGRKRKEDQMRCTHSFWLFQGMDLRLTCGLSE
jgi:serine/threonine protein kinase